MNDKNKFKNLTVEEFMNIPNEKIENLSKEESRDFYASGLKLVYRKFQIETANILNEIINDHKINGIKKLDVIKQFASFLINYEITQDIEYEAKND